MLSSFISKYKEYNRIAKITEMARRFFVMSSFDGILTVIGIVLGSYFAGITEQKIVIFTSVATCFSMMVSGIWGTFLTESAERKKKIHDLGKHVMTDLRETKIAKAQKFASMIIAAIDGFAPVISGLLVLVPFFLKNILPIKAAYVLSIGLALFMLSVLGSFLGKISKENIFISGMKMLVAGIVSIMLIFLLEHLA